MPRLSVVIPCYNEAENVAELYGQLCEVVSCVGGDAEFLFVDDGSRDGTLARLRDLAGRDARVRAVSLSRNFGHQAALSAGIDHARGDAVVVMDADLQHPPELIRRFVERWAEGYDIVYAYREGVKPRLGYRIINRLMRVRIPPESADFRLMDRRVVEAFRHMPERTRFIRGMLSWLGFRQAGVGYQDRERFAGQRAYTLHQTARMALNAVLSFSIIPLRLASLLGLVTLLAGLAYAVYVLFAWWNGWNLARGWPALIMTILILGGVQLICLGIIAEYIGRVFEEVKHRPLYVVREEVGGGSETGTSAR
ncbi:MAG TPA: glycosyltransferase family 2 protein [Phycisphaerae bacterium]|nr:glycosyltransferase family 2 protein [Phycisphaerae bacterium]HRY67531.1 glycosyltransferase family 2 protein [Phycisphaerae bacterium]HSA24918.1 glycosyltransferase family 2 protein [Phycisphaerae bacterium]